MSNRSHAEVDESGKCAWMWRNPLLCNHIHSRYLVWRIIQTGYGTFLRCRYCEDETSPLTRRIDRRYAHEQTEGHRHRLEQYTMYLPDTDKSHHSFLPGANAEGLEALHNSATRALLGSLSDTFAASNAEAVSMSRPSSAGQHAHDADQRFWNIMRDDSEQPSFDIDTVQSMSGLVGSLNEFLEHHSGSGDEDDASESGGSDGSDWLDNDNHPPNPTSIFADTDEEIEEAFQGQIFAVLHHALSLT